MRSESEIKELKKVLAKLTEFIAEHGDLGEFDKEDWTYACNVCDALSWVLGEIKSDHFQSDAHLSVVELRRMAVAVEVKSGKRLADYG